MSTYWKNLIVALDVTDEKKARAVIEALSPDVKIFKVGLIPYTKFGPKIIEWINTAGAQVFVDFKLFDIPNTMAETAKVFLDMNAWGFTIHTRCGEKPLRTVKEALEKEACLRGVSAPLMVGVTELTSDGATWDDVATLAALAKKVRLPAVVCSVWEAQQIKKEFDLLTVTPGIRNAAVGDDQKRVATVKQAIENKADFWVVGRPIVGAADYRKAAQELITV